METSKNARSALAAAAAAAAAAVAVAVLAACSDVPERRSATTTAPSNTSSKSTEAETALTAADGTSAGSVTFTAVTGGTDVDIKVTANRSVAAGRFHGIHVHANNDPANGEGCRADPTDAPSMWFTSADGHLKEGPATHNDHKGDLPSLLVAKDGSASLRFTTDRFTPTEVIGKAVILHAGADNFGNIPTGTLPDQYTANEAAATTKTEATGNAGDRMACGVVAKS